MSSAYFRTDIDLEGDALIKSIVTDLPQIYYTMPYNWVERLWKYCLWVYVYPQQKPENGDSEQSIIFHDNQSELFSKFSIFLDYMFSDKVREGLFVDFKKKMDQGFEIITKSYFKPNAGTVEFKKLTFLEHYLLLVQEDPSIFNRKLFNHLYFFTHEGDKIVEKYRHRSYNFLGMFV